MRRLFEGGVYSRAAFILPSGLPPFPATPPPPPPPQRSCELCPRPLALSPARAMADLELELAQFSFSSAIRGHLATHLRMHIATVHMNAATVQGRPLLRVLCGAYSRAAFIRGAAFIQGNTVCTTMVFTHNIYTHQCTHEYKSIHIWCQISD